MRIKTRLASLFTIVTASFCGAQTPEVSFLLRQDFGKGKPDEALWESNYAQVEAAGVAEVSPLGFLRVLQANPKDGLTLVSRQVFERKPGLTLAVVHCGNVTRGGTKDNPVFQFAPASGGAGGVGGAGGAGWMPGQHQGRFINTVLPLVVAGRGYPIRNDNADKLFLTVMRPQGAMYLIAGEPTSSLPLARLCYVSERGAEKQYQAEFRSGKANTFLNSISVAALGGRWAEPFGVASIFDDFEREALARPIRGGDEWRASGAWSLSKGRAEGEGILLTRGAAEGQWDAVITPAPAPAPAAASAPAAAARTQQAGVILRAKDDRNYLAFVLTPEGSRLIKCSDGQASSVKGFDCRDVKLAPGETHRLSVRLEGAYANLYVDDRVAMYGINTKATEALAGLPEESFCGLISLGGKASFEHFAQWPALVAIPPALADVMPPLPLHADGEIVVHDDFEGEDGVVLDGRKPKVGTATWKIGGGPWSIRDGAAMCAATDTFAHIDTGVNDYEISLKVQLPMTNPKWGKDWFPGIHARSVGARRLEMDGGINGRFLWQDGSNEIEVWDCPPPTEANVEKWGRPIGDGKRSLRTELINATNITPMIRPGETHLLRLVVRGNRVTYFCDDLLVGSAWTRVDRGSWAGINVDREGDTGCRFLEFKVRAFK